MRVLIIGATGGTGRELVRQALERGHEVTALARNPARVVQGYERLRVRSGNVLDYASVSEAVEGQDAVLSALGHKRWLGPSNILSEGTANVVRAMKERGVKRLVVVTALGVSDSRFRMGLYYTLFVIPIILPFYWFDKARQERVVRESGLDWTIVRPGQLTNRPSRGVRKHGAGVGSFLWTVRMPRADVAAFMLDKLEAGMYLHRCPGVC